MDYPDLKELETRFLKILNNDNLYKKLRKERKENNIWFGPVFAAEVFPQTWASNVLAFDVKGDGSANKGKGAILEAYTVVMHERATGFYAVFVDSRLCYYIYNGSPRFFNDLRRRQMGTASFAQNNY